MESCSADTASGSTTTERDTLLRADHDGDHFAVDRWDRLTDASVAAGVGTGVTHAMGLMESGKTGPGDASIACAPTQGVNSVLEPAQEPFSASLRIARPLPRSFPSHTRIRSDEMTAMA